MPSAAAGTGRRSRSNRPESSQEFGRRSVKFSDDLGLDDDAFGVKKRPSTAPGGRNRKDDELGIDDPFTRSLPGKSGKTLPYPTLPYPFFPYPTLLFFSLPYPTPPNPTWHYLSLPYSLQRLYLVLLNLKRMGYTIPFLPSHLSVLDLIFYYNLFILPHTSLPKTTVIGLV